MTDRPGDEAEPIEVEAVADDRPAGNAARTPEERATARRRRRGRLFLLLWLLPVVLIAALGYLVAAQPERLAAFLAGPPPDMASAADIERLADRLQKAEAAALDRAQADANAAAIAASREEIEAAAGEAAALREALGAFERRLDARLEALEARIAALERAEPAVDPAVAAEIAGLRETLAALEARPAGNGSADPGLAPLKAAVAALDRRLGGLEASDRAAVEAGASADKALAELAVLRDAVTKLALSGEAGGGVKLAAARLRFAVESGAPFREELDAVEAAGGPGFGAWTAHAEQGLPTADVLARRFKALARARTLRPDGATGTPWLDDVIGRLSDVVSVRQVSRDLPGEDADAALGRAEAHIEDGNLAGAVAELGGDLPLPFEGWRLVARDRLAADAELEALTARDGR
ncbi:MAG: hypothetical protein OXH14_08675 [Alphaproteobacteria bacterium]|nr:hypothetical protein [Alphaproteobacteria bacterium]